MSRSFNVTVNSFCTFDERLSEAEFAKIGRVYDASFEPPEEGERAPQLWAALSDEERAIHIAWERIGRQPSLLGDADADVVEAVWVEDDDDGGRFEPFGLAVSGVVADVSAATSRAEPGKAIRQVTLPDGGAR